MYDLGTIVHIYATMYFLTKILASWSMSTLRAYIMQKIEKFEEKPSQPLQQTTIYQLNEKHENIFCAKGAL